MDLELRHLRVVVTIAQTGSLTKAAALLGLAQPALTAQLQRIERTLGGQLFERDRRGARPTALGEFVLARAAVLLPAMQNLQDEAARLAGDGAVPSRFRIGAISGSPIVGGLVHRLVEARPSAQITTFASMSTQELATMLAGGKLEYAVIGLCGGGSSPPGQGLVWRTVAREPIFVMVREDHPAATVDEVDLADLRDERWVAAPGGENCLGDCFVSACARAGFSPRQLWEVDRHAATELVEAGQAVALCQPTYRPLPGLVTRPLAGSILRWHILVGWQPETDAAGLGENVLEFAADAYHDAISRSQVYLRWLGQQSESVTRVSPAEMSQLA